MKSDMFCDDMITMLLDKPYAARFTMRAAFALERLYGSVRSAVAALDTAAPERAVAAVVRIACLLTGLAPGVVEDILNEDIFKFYDCLRCIYELLLRDFPAAEGAPGSDDIGEGSDEGYDWDWLYYTARYRLRMSDEEFWDETPRRIWKMNRLWMQDRGYIKTTDTPARAYIDEIDF